MNGFKILLNNYDERWIENGWTMAVLSMIVLVILMNVIFFARSCCHCCRKCCCNRIDNDKQSNGGYKSSVGYRTIVWDNSDDEHDCYSDDVEVPKPGEDKQFIIGNDENGNENEENEENELIDDSSVVVI